jgi:hypothetical protein
MNPQDDKEQQRREIERLINEARDAERRQAERNAERQHREESASGNFDPPRAKDDAKPPPDNED